MLLRFKKGQSTVEYAIIIGVVVAALVAMQTYVKRGLQARYHDGVVYMQGQVNGIANAGAVLGNTAQYEPYYVNTNYRMNQSQVQSQFTGVRGQINTTGMNESTTRTGNEREMYSNFD